MLELRHLPEVVVTGKRLGRHVEFDERSRSFRVAFAPRPRRTVHHRAYGLPLNQGDIGACTGFAGAGALNTTPLRRAGQHSYTEVDAVGFYEDASRLDDIPGTYPPEDTGSSGLAVAKALKARGLVASYRHAFGIDDALGALQDGPVLTGVDWHEGMDDPDATGFVQSTGQVRGGHEFVVVAYVQARTPFVEAVNSWGLDYGLNGRFRFTVATWDALLQAQGDATVLVRA